MTTKRYTLSDLGEMLKKNDHELYMLKVGDCFCDHGSVGLVILIKEGEIVNIDTFILSCRVIARGIESAFLDWLKDDLRKRKFRFLRGKYSRSAKNGPCEKTYSDNDFSKVSDNGEESIYEYDLSCKKSKTGKMKLVKVIRTKG